MFGSFWGLISTEPKGLESLQVSMQQIAILYICKICCESRVMRMAFQMKGSYLEPVQTENEEKKILSDIRLDFLPMDEAGSYIKILN